MELVLHLCFLFLIGGYIFSRGLSLLSRRDFFSLYGEFYIPFFLYVVYGLFGLSLYYQDAQARYSYAGVIFSDLSVIFGFLVIIIPILTISLIFRFSHCGLLARKTMQADGVRSQKFVNLLVLFFFAFDLVARVKMIHSGEYFSWLRGALAAKGEISTGGWLTSLQVSIEPILAALLVYKLTRSKRWLIPVLCFFGLIVLKGQRSAIIEALIPSILTFLTFSEKRINYSQVAKHGLLFLLLVSVTSSIITDVRTQFRRDGAVGLGSPVEAMEKIAFEYFPAAVLGEVEGERVKNTGLPSRLALWTGSFSSELERQHSGIGFMPLEDFTKALSLPVPSLLYPGKKPVVEQGVRTAEWFGLGENRPNVKYDGGSTIFSDVHKFGGFVFVFILSVLFGLALVFLATFCVRRFGSIGLVLFFGTAFMLDVRANSYANFLVDFRNLVLVLILIELLRGLARFSFKARYEPPKRLKMKGEISAS